MAINAGGETTIAANDEVFERDRYFQGGVVSKKGQGLTINGTDSPALYQTERFAIGEELWYSLPIPFNVGHNDRGWTFVLTLKFVEVQFNATGKRMFGVNLNGLHVLRDIDVFSMVGYGTAYDEHIEFKIDPDHYAIWVTSVGPMRVRIEQPAAFYGDLHVALTPTEFGNARLCAMQLQQGTLEEVEAALEQSSPHRRLSSKKKRQKRGGGDGVFTLRIGLLCLAAGAALALLGREILAWRNKKRALPAKLREKLVSQPAQNHGRRSKTDTPQKPRKEKKSSGSNSPDSQPKDRNEQQHRQSETKSPASPRTQAKRDERTRLKKEAKDKQREKARAQSMRAEVEALAKAKAAAENAARRSAAAMAALREAEEAEAAQEAVALREQAAEAEERRRSAREAELAARAQAKSLKARLKKRQRQAAMKLKASEAAAAAQKEREREQKPQQQEQEQARAPQKPAGFPAPGPTQGLATAQVDWSSTGSLAGLPVTSDANDDLDVDVFAVLQDEILNPTGGGGDAADDDADLDSRLLSNLIEFLDTDDSDSESVHSESVHSVTDSSYSATDTSLADFDFSAAAAVQLSANAPEFTPATTDDSSDVGSMSVEDWMEAHQLSQYTTYLLTAGAKTVDDLLAMPLTHDHLKSIGLTKLRGRLLLMNSLKSLATE
jgi:hypothetical protein